MKKLFVILLVCAMTVNSAICVPLSVSAGEAQTRTVMLYMIGANLESQDGSATSDFIESMYADYDENLNYIVITGGTKEWQTPAEYLVGATEIDPEYNQIWKLEGKKQGEEHGKMILLEEHGMPGFEKTILTETSVLTAFADYCTDNFPADLYDIILWDHGGGPAGGFGHDERTTEGNSLKVSELMQSFSDTKLVQNGKKFEIIDFDACLMASVEIVAALGEYADYLVLSPESEPGLGQEYTTWLDAVKENPNMNGFDLGITIVDAMIDFYTFVSPCEATLSVIDVDNFNDRLLTPLMALDDVLISEAKNVGKRNNRYNFYDELYSLDYSFSYNFGTVNLYDLGNLACAISTPQSEMNNISQAQISKYSNVYTSIALQILTALSDNDNSGDDVIYTGKTHGIKKTFDAGFIHDAQGNMVYADDNGKITQEGTGLSFYFGGVYGGYTNSFTTDMVACSQAATDSSVKEFLKKRAVSAVYYSLIMDFGKMVSMLSDKGVKHINYEKVKKGYQDYKTWDKYFVVLINSLVSNGEFESVSDCEDYLAEIVYQQSAEVISKDKVEVKQIRNADGSFDSYKVTVSNTSAQAFMNVNASVKAVCKYTDTPEFTDMVSYLYGSHTLDELFPNGINIKTTVTEGVLDYADYVETVNDTLAQFYQRIYASSTNIWKVPEVSGKCFVLYDDDGKPHLADIRYLDKSYQTAYIPIVLYAPADANNGIRYERASIFITEENGVWSVKGLSYESEDTAERTYFPMDNDHFTGLSFSTATSIRDSIYYYDAPLPISSFDDIDITKENWGISFGVMSADDLDEIASYESHYSVRDVYNYNIDVTEKFTDADTAAAGGDVVYDIGAAEVEVAKAVYDGFEQRPAVKVTVNGKELTQNEDYKVYYFGYVQPGEAYLDILGLDGYIGEKTVRFEIEKPAQPDDNATPSGTDNNNAPDGTDDNAPSVKPSGGETAAKTDISGWKVSGIKDATYTGKVIKQNINVSKNGEYADIKVTYKNNLEVGTATVTIKGKGDYTGVIVRTFKIKKAKNTLKVKAKSKTVKYSTVKKKKLTISRKKLLTVSNPVGTLSYKKVSGNKKITLDKKTGKFTVKKGLKKGTYKVKVKVKAAGNKSYKSLTKTVTVTVKVN